MTLLRKGKADPRHTISAPNIAEVYGGFVRQLKVGTPWALVTNGAVIIDEGVAGAQRDAWL